MNMMKRILTRGRYNHSSRSSIPESMVVEAGKKALPNVSMKIVRNS
jgi:hypothetical protein